MSRELELAVAVAVGLFVVWTMMVAGLYVVGRRTSDPTRLRDVLRLVPDVVRLLRRLAADPTLPRGVRIRLAILVAYLASPIDLVPDFIPVVGYADDAIIVAIGLRAVARTAGVEAIERHWPGTPEGLTVLRRLVGLPA